MDGMIVFEKQFLYGQFKEWNYTELEIDLSEKQKVNVSEMYLILITVTY